MKNLTLPAVGERVCIQWNAPGFPPLTGIVLQASHLGLHLDTEPDSEFEFEFDLDFPDGTVAVPWSLVRRVDPVPVPAGRRAA